ncbi:Histone-lysine N-methyltransferase, H3 lysine-79 specific, partial [Ophiophagus hannah]
MCHVLAIPMPMPSLVKGEKLGYITCQRCDNNQERKKKKGEKKEGRKEGKIDKEGRKEGRKEGERQERKKKNRRKKEREREVGKEKNGEEGPQTLALDVALEDALKQHSNQGLEGTSEQETLYHLGYFGASSTVEKFPEKGRSLLGKAAMQRKAEIQQVRMAEISENEDSDEGPACDAGMGPELLKSGVLPLELVESGSSDEEEPRVTVLNARARRASSKKRAAEAARATWE